MPELVYYISIQFFLISTRRKLHLYFIYFSTVFADHCNQNNYFKKGSKPNNERLERF